MRIAVVGDSIQNIAVTVVNNSAVTEKEAIDYIGDRRLCRSFLLQHIQLGERRNTQHKHEEKEYKFFQKLQILKDIITKDIA